MTIKTKKARSKNILYFTPEDYPNQDYELKCHLIASPEPYGISSEYILHDLQLDATAEEGLCMKLRYRHKEDKTQVLVVSIVFPPDSNFFFDYILLHCGKSDAKDLNFLDKSCNSVKEILGLILNRTNGEHCSTCAFKFKQRLTGRCSELYSKNRYQNTTE